MKRRGTLTLINYTLYDWIKTQEKNHSMLHWQFPEIIPAYSRVHVDIEWNRRQDQANSLESVVHYMLFGSKDRLFHILASHNTACSLRIYFANLATRELPLGSTLDLQWKNTEHLHFRLSGYADEFEEEVNAPSLATLVR